MSDGLSRRRRIAMVFLTLFPTLTFARPEPTPNPERSTFDLLKELESRVVDEKARDKRLVIGIRVSDNRKTSGRALQGRLAGSA